MIEKMIDAVNAKDAGKYVEGFTDSVKVFVDAELKIEGKGALQQNRANHFDSHPA